MMKKGLVMLMPLLLCGVLFSGCNVSLPFGLGAEPNKSSSQDSAVSDLLTQASAQSKASKPNESKAIVSSAVSSSAPSVANTPYLKEIPAEACVFRSPDADSGFSQTIGQDGTFTIVEEKRHGNGELWGRLKSGVGWVNLSNFFCHGGNMPAVTVSETGKVVKKSAHHQGGETAGEYVVYLTFMAHRTVLDLTLTEENPVGNQTVMTMSKLTPEKPLVVGVLLSDVNSFELTYQDVKRTRGSARVDQNLGNGLALEFSYS